MARNKMDDLRNHLFATLEALQDKDEPMDIERALAVKDVASVLVETAKVECMFLKATADMGNTGSGFFQLKNAE